MFKMCILERRERSHVISQLVSAMTLYSVCVEDRDIVECGLFFTLPTN